MNNAYPLQAGQRHYGWGSHLLYGLFDLPQHDEQPLAELWLGGHPSLPSKVQTHEGNWTRLDKHLEKKPLNFLLKVLSAAKPLSLQVHPDSNQAELGYQLENDLNIPLHADHRNYKDRFAKPEMVMALTPFKIMVGFRELKEVKGNLSQIQSPLLNAIIEQADFDFQDLVLTLLALPRVEKQKIISQTLALALTRNCPMWQQVVDLGQYYPHDIGLLAPLYLNCLTLEPGEVMYLPAGTIHAYTQGTCVELMGCSDNVLRAGLTPKHIDIKELTKCTRFETFKPELLSPQALNHESIFQPAETEFGLSQYQVESNGESLVIATRSIILLVQGTVQLNEMSLSAGQSILIEPGEYIMSGKGLLIRAFERESNSMLIN